MLQQNLVIEQLSQIELEQKSFLNSSNGEPQDNRLSFNIPSFSAQKQKLNRSHDINDSQQGKFFIDLFNRASDLGYQALSNTKRTIVLESAQPQRVSSNRGDHFNNGLTPSENNSFSQRIGENAKLNKHLFEKVNRILQITSDLVLIKKQVLQYIGGLREIYDGEFKKINEIFISNIMSLDSFYKSAQQEYITRLHSVEKQLEDKKNQLEVLKIQKHNTTLDQLAQAEDISQMKHQLQKCNNYIDQLLSQNEQLKYELAKLSAQEKECKAYQQQLQMKNEQLERNSQYIFDLQQRLVDYSYEFNEKQRLLKKQFQKLLLIQKEKIELNNEHELQKAKQELTQKIQEQLSYEYQQTINSIHLDLKQQTIRLREQVNDKKILLAQQRKHYQSVIKGLQNERSKLAQQKDKCEQKIEALSHNKHKIQKIGIPRKYYPILIKQDQTRQPIEIGIKTNDRDYNHQFKIKKNDPQRFGKLSESSFFLQQQKDIRMRNISNKLLQLRADIKQQIGIIKN